MLLPRKKLLALLVATFAMPIAPTVFAHGTIIDPPSRHKVCYDKHGHWNGTLTGACRAALEANGTGAFDNWNGYTGFAVSPHGVEQAKKGIPNGKLCSGTTPYDAFNQPRSDWETKTIEPDANGIVQMKYVHTAMHSPSFIEFYISKKNVDVTKKKLGWDDVELIHTFNIQSGDLSPTHTINVPIPEGRTGKSIIFTRWQRIDPAGEGFYACSDVNITARSGAETPDPDDQPGGEDDAVQGQWFESGKFIQSEKVAVGDKVRFRIMGGAKGNELIDIKFLITENNLKGNKWIANLAKKINTNYSNDVLIGQMTDSGVVEFNGKTPRKNSVYLNSKTNGFAISIIKAANEGDNGSEQDGTIIVDGASIMGVQTLNQFDQNGTPNLKLTVKSAKQTRLNVKLMGPLGMAAYGGAAMQAGQEYNIDIEGIDGNTNNVAGKYQLFINANDIEKIVDMTFTMNNKQALSNVGNIQSTGAVTSEKFQVDVMQGKKIIEQATLMLPKDKLGHYDWPKFLADAINQQMFNVRVKTKDAVTGEMTGAPTYSQAANRFMVPNSQYTVTYKNIK
ncbi:hypothetical protein GA565_11805 [Rouxiella sp. S1S-2]|uniref:lytic polysaccharide monooxygenase n=1 Tax=Rouxiella sp. S1S-2 TaxID=2653856 RepID=UPI0012640519|nr:lytic polysaccharide monooxygenase [Rouxiella sp. S1S-2]KAB7896609.1 hypothetical protein GA565_11805 [Rouxiella sp. S1S-2]